MNIISELTLKTSKFLDHWTFYLIVKYFMGFSLRQQYLIFLRKVKCITNVQRNFLIKLLLLSSLSFSDTQIKFHLALCSHSVKHQQLKLILKIYFKTPSFCNCLLLRILNKVFLSSKGRHSLCSV